MKLTRINKQEQYKEDWDFDMSLYEEEDKKIEEITSLQKMLDNKPNQSNLKFKNASWGNELEALTAIKTKIGEYAIKVSQNTTEINDLWNLYGAMEEYWARIEDIFGRTIIMNMRQLFKSCRVNLESNKDTDDLNYILHRKLLHLRKMIYMVTQRSGLGIATERRMGGSMQQAKKAIEE